MRTNHKFKGARWEVAAPPKERDSTPAEFIDDVFGGDSYNIQPLRPGEILSKYRARSVVDPKDGNLYSAYDAVQITFDRRGYERRRVAWVFTHNEPSLKFIYDLEDSSLDLHPSSRVRYSSAQEMADEFFRLTTLIKNHGVVLVGNEKDE